MIPDMTNWVMTLDANLLSFFPSHRLCALIALSQFDKGTGKHLFEKPGKHWVFFLSPNSVSITILFLISPHLPLFQLVLCNTMYSIIKYYGPKCFAKQQKKKCWL